jgi:phosphoadenosine phosphosulfate reductase
MQNTLFEPSEQDLVNRALAQPLDQKIERAIMLLKHYESAALKLDPRGYWVADSFGKDSDCICELAKMASVTHHCEHNITTIDPPELVRWGKKNRSTTNINRPKKHLLHKMVEMTTPPTRIMRWCCAEYKEGSGTGFGKVIGVRISESANRAKRWSEFVRDRKDTNGFYLCPISYWTDSDVWEFHRIRNIPHCELYDQGFSRLGCIGCPLSTPKGQRKSFDRWPKYEAMWKQAFVNTWNRWAHIPTRFGKQRSFVKFGSPEGWYNWWISGIGFENGADCQGAELFPSLDARIEDEE